MRGPIYSGARIRIRATIIGMGLLKVRVTVRNPKDESRLFEEDFWVDTGALYTFIPEDRLQAIGVEPIRGRDLVLADGRRERRLLGEAVIRIEGHDESLTCPVIFAPAGALYLLGATALENFGLDVDPSTKTLKPILAIIGGVLGSAALG